MKNKHIYEPEVIAYLLKGQKIKAVKKLYEIRRIGLKEAKELVDSYVIDNDQTQYSDSKVKSFGGIIYLVISLGLAGFFLVKYFK
jgi:ribosomal protein L7/L12